MNTRGFSAEAIAGEDADTEDAAAGGVAWVCAFAGASGIRKRMRNSTVAIMRNLFMWRSSVAR
jgi:hypothetical protein